MHIQQSGRLRIIRRFKNFNPVDSSRAGIKVIQIIPPRALRRGMPRDNQREKAASIRMRMPLVA